MNRFAVNNGFISVTSADRFCFISNPSFDASSFDLWCSLLNGASLVIFDRETVLDVDAFGKALRENDVNVGLMTTALFNQISAKTPIVFSLFKYLLIGGEAQKPSAVREALAHGKPGSLLNAYGPTECTTMATAYDIEEVAENATSVPIGRPISNTSLYVLNREMQPCPIGVSGELYVGGSGLARGYVNQPDFTAWCFVPNPFSSKPGGRLYRTGDLVRYLPTGELDFISRIDNQVKIRGFRIEMTEIAVTLGRHPNVARAIVVIRETNHGEKQLLAYVIAHDRSPEPKQLRKFLKERLPDYMIPHGFTLIDEVPLTPNGKIDYNALPLPGVHLEIDDEFSGSELKTVLAGVFASLLNLPAVGVNDNFFELGGHSLLATQLISRVRNVFSVEVPLRALFEAPTVATFAEYVSAALNGETSSEPITPIERNRDLPLSFAQQRLWFLDQLENHGSVYNIPIAVSICGPLSPGVMRKAIAAILDRHEVLRTRIVSRDGVPVQVIEEQAPLSFQLIDLSEADEEIAKSQRQKIMKTEAQRPFNLTQAPMLRACLIRRDENTHTLLLTLHHIAGDGWSMSVLLKEIRQLYSAFKQGEPSPLAPLPIQYVDFAYWQRQQLSGEALDRHINYWLRRLGGQLPPPPLQTDFPRPNLPSYQGAVHRFTLDATRSADLRKMARREDCTLFMLMLAAFQALLFRITGTKDILVGTHIANRNRIEAEDLIGFFVNNLLLRADFIGNPEFRTMLAKVRRTVLEAYAHQDMPYDKLIEVLKQDRSPNQAPLAQIQFTLQNMPTVPLDFEGLRLEILDQEPIARYELSVFLHESKQNIEFVWLYRSDLFCAETIERISFRYNTLLDAILENADTPVNRLEYRGERERTEQDQQKAKRKQNKFAKFQKFKGKSP